MFFDVFALLALILILTHFTASVTPFLHFELDDLIKILLELVQIDKNHLLILLEIT